MRVEYDGNRMTRIGIGAGFMWLADSGDWWITNRREFSIGPAINLGGGHSRLMAWFLDELTSEVGSQAACWYVNEALYQQAAEELDAIDLQDEITWDEYDIPGPRLRAPGSGWLVG